MQRDTRLLSISHRPTSLAENFSPVGTARKLTKTMLFKSLAIVALLAQSAVADQMSQQNLRAGDLEDTSGTTLPAEVGVEHLDLEVTLENGERELFPLLPGTKCPTGHTCRSRNIGTGAGVSPLVASMKDNMKAGLKASMDWQEFNNDMITVVKSGEKLSGAKATPLGIRQRARCSVLCASSF